MEFALAAEHLLAQRGVAVECQRAAARRGLLTETKIVSAVEPKPPGWMKSSEGLARWMALEARFKEVQVVLGKRKRAFLVDRAWESMLKLARRCQDVESTMTDERSQAVLAQIFALAAPPVATAATLEG
eukprot:7597814-Pyramimonas_sp.AAC.1